MSVTNDVTTTAGQFTPASTVVMIVPGVPITIGAVLPSASASLSLPSLSVAFAGLNTLPAGNVDLTNTTV